MLSSSEASCSETCGRKRRTALRDSCGARFKGQAERLGHVIDAAGHLGNRRADLGRQPGELVEVES